MGKNRPNWGKGVRKDVLAAQNNLCAWCGEAIAGKFEVHHDFQGHKWHEIDKLLQSDSMKALGLSGDAKLRKWIYRDRRNLYAMHPSCHVQADRAQEEGRLIMEQVRKA